MPADERTRTRHAAVHELLRQGVGLLECSRRLGWALNTIKRYAHAESVEQRAHLQDLFTVCPPLAVLAEHVRAFAELLTSRRGGELEQWMRAVEAADLPALHAFVRGLRKDLPAVIAGLSQPYSNGPIEGANTKVKLLKRQMYGRAGFPLLRRRILLS